MLEQRFNIRVEVDSIDKAKIVAGEWALMFNQSLDYDVPPMIILINPRHEGDEVSSVEQFTIIAYPSDEGLIDEEDYLEAMSVFDDL